MEQKFNYTDIFFPKTLGEWSLLTVLLLLLGAGWYFYRHSEARWQAQLEKLRDDELTDVVAEDSIKELITTSWQDSFLQSLPGIFLIVGLLGTFISLGISLIKLAPVIDEVSNGNTSGLEGVLDALGTKFKTSIWGIIFNLLFRLGFLYRLENTLSRLIKENLSNLSEKWKSKEEAETTRYNQVISKNDEIITVLNRLATATDQGNRDYVEVAKHQEELNRRHIDNQTAIFSALGSQLISQNDKIIFGLTELEKEVGKGNQISTIFHEYQSRFQENFRNETIAYRDKSLQLQDESKKYLLSVSETLVPFGQSVKDLGPIIVNMKELVNTVSNTLTTATNDFGGVAKGLNESVSTFKTEIEKALKESSDIMTKNAGEMGNSINRFNDQIKTSFAEFSESVNGTLKSISDALEKSTGEMKVTITGSIENTKSVIEDTKSVIERLDRHLGGIDQVLSETKATLGAINEKFSEINEVIERVADSAKQVAGDSSRANIELTGVFKEKGILNNQLQALIESQKRLNRLVVAFPRQRLTEIGQELGQIKDTVERLTTSSATITDVFKENGVLNGQLQLLLDSQAKMNGLVAAFSPQQLTEIGQELGQIKNTVERLTNSTSSLYNELPSSLDGRGFLGTKLSSLIENQQDISKKIVDAILANTNGVVHTTKGKDNGEQEHNGEYRKNSELPTN